MSKPPPPSTSPEKAPTKINSLTTSGGTKSLASSPQQLLPLLPNTIQPLPPRTIGGLRDQIPKIKQCNCRRSHCLKLYCECFAAGLCCTDSCRCIECHNNNNTLSNSDSRNEAIRMTLMRNVNAFRTRVMTMTPPSSMNAPNYSTSPPNVQKYVSNTTAAMSGGSSCNREQQQFIPPRQNTVVNESLHPIKLEQQEDNGSSCKMSTPFTTSSSPINMKQDGTTTTITTNNSNNVHLPINPINTMTQSNPKPSPSPINPLTQSNFHQSSSPQHQQKTPPPIQQQHQQQQHAHVPQSQPSTFNNNNKFSSSLPSSSSSMITNTKLGCNCRKSFCLKKYCECFQASIYCTSLCNCTDCQNVIGNVQREVLVNLNRKREEKECRFGVGGGFGGGSTSPSRGLGTSVNPKNPFQMMFDNGGGGGTTSSSRSRSTNTPMTSNTLAARRTAVLAAGIAANGIDIFLPPSSYTIPMTLERRIIGEVAFGTVGRQIVGGAIVADDDDNDDNGGGTTLTKDRCRSDKVGNKGGMKRKRTTSNDPTIMDDNDDDDDDDDDIIVGETDLERDWRLATKDLNKKFQATRDALLVKEEKEEKEEGHDGSKSSIVLTEQSNPDNDDDNDERKRSSTSAESNHNNHGNTNLKKKQIDQLKADIHQLKHAIHEAESIAEKNFEKTQNTKEESTNKDGMNKKKYSLRKRSKPTEISSTTNKQQGDHQGGESHAISLSNTCKTNNDLLLSDDEDDEMLESNDSLLCQEEMEMEMEPTSSYLLNNTASMDALKELHIVSNQNSALLHELARIVRRRALELAQRRIQRQR